MRDGWKTITLNDACIQMNGIWKGTKEPLVPAKVLRTTNISKDCRIKLDDLAVIDVEKKKLEARRLQRGDIIVEKSGGGPKQPVGRVILFDMDDEDYSFCNFTSALRIRDKEQLDFNYLHKYLTYLYFEGETEKYQSNLVGFRNLDFKGYVGIEVPYPSLPEQQRIVDILDQEFAKIDALKANAEKSLQAAKDLFQATLKKELEPKEGWKRQTIGDVCYVQGGSTPRRTEKAFWENGTYPWFTVDDIREQGRIITDTKQKITKLAWEKMRVFPANSVLLCCTASVGEYALSTIPISSNQQFNGLTIKDERTILPMFLFHFASTLKDTLLSLSGKTTIDFVSGGKVRSVPISFPASVKKQECIISRLDDLNDKCNALQDNYQKTLALCDDLKQSLLRKAFNGEL